MPNFRQPKEVWDETRRKAWERDGGVCQSPLQPPICCGKLNELSLETCHVDHIIPLSLGGSNALSNQRVLCRACHVLRVDDKHRGMIANALRDDVIPPDWRGHVWN